ncbi:PcfJ domain-containing protein, partial [Nevskia ramosa]|uniref:PcfJ domain-containing protein n=1 Tax=Nevskia ramosa TaxID=64002 RepID=UPI0023550369
MLKTAKQVVAHARSESRRKRSMYDGGGRHDEPLSAEDEKLVFSVCADLVEKESFGDPSFRTYIELQGKWSADARSLRSNVIDAVYKAVSKHGSKSRKLPLLIEKAWCAMAGASFHGFFLNALRYHSRVMSKDMWRQAVFIRYTGMSFSPLLTDLDGFDRAWEQNATLTLFACTVDQNKARSLGENCFGQLKMDWLAHGGTDSDFRWFSKRSKSWLHKVLWNQQKAKADSFSLASLVSALRLRDCEFSSVAVQTFLSVMLGKVNARRTEVLSEELKRAVLITAMKRSLETRTGRAADFNPLKHREDKGDVRSYYLNQIENISHFLQTLQVSELRKLADTATMTSLKYKAEAWALEVRRKARAKLEQKVFPSVKEPLIVVGPYRFEFLKTALDLVDEGEKNRHCIADYTDRCVLGTFRAYRMSSENRSVTTSMKVRNGRWVFDQLEGFYGWSSPE